MPEIMERYWALPQAERERLMEYIKGRETKDD